jgi:hypothetical protein
VNAGRMVSELLARIRRAGLVGLPNRDTSEPRTCCRRSDRRGMELETHPRDALDNAWFSPVVVAVPANAFALGEEPPVLLV